MPLPCGRRDSDLLASVRGILRGERARGPCVLADRALLELLVLLLSMSRAKASFHQISATAGRQVTWNQTHSRDHHKGSISLKM